jgi:hypothetical protein
MPSKETIQVLISDTSFTISPNEKLKAVDGEGNPLDWGKAVNLADLRTVAEEHNDATHTASFAPTAEIEESEGLKRTLKRKLDAKFLLALVASPAMRDGLLGDLDEQYEKNLERFDAKRAKLIFWRDATAAAAWLFGARLLKLAGLALALEKLRKFL